MERQDKIILTGAAGLVGQNLLVPLKQWGYRHLVAIDKHAYLTVDDQLTGVNITAVFGVTPTPFEEAIRETFGGDIVKLFSNVKSDDYG